MGTIFLFYIYPLFLFLISSLARAPLQGTDFSLSLSFPPTLHSLCPWDTPFIYFLLNFSALSPRLISCGSC